MSKAALDIALPLVAKFEGCRLAPYQDAGGMWTIGYGDVYLTDGSMVSADTPPITQTEALSLLRLVLSSTATRVDVLLPASATDNQRAALYSFAYNEGVGALEHSTLLRMFLAGQIENAAQQFLSWVYADGQKLAGLVTRRETERDVFLGTNLVANVSTEGQKSVTGTQDSAT